MVPLFSRTIATYLPTTMSQLRECVHSHLTPIALGIVSGMEAVTHRFLQPNIKKWKVSISRINSSFDLTQGVLGGMNAVTSLLLVNKVLKEVTIKSAFISTKVQQLGYFGIPVLMGSVYLMSVAILEGYYKYCSAQKLTATLDLNKDPITSLIYTRYENTMVMTGIQEHQIETMPVQLSIGSVWQKNTQRWHLTKLILNVALICLTQNRIWLLLGISSSIYNFYKQSFDKTLRIAQTIKYNPPFPIPIMKDNFLVKFVRVSKVIIGYDAALPANTRPNPDRCPICLDVPASHVFCDSQAAHHNCCENCAATQIATHINTFDIRSCLFKPGNWSSVSLDLREFSLFPPCAFCRQELSGHDWNIQFKGIAFADDRYVESVQIINYLASSKNKVVEQLDSDYYGRELQDIAVFEKAYAVYNVIYGGLIQLLYPNDLDVIDFGCGIFFGIPGLLYTTCHLYLLIHQKNAEKEIPSFKTDIALIVSALAVALFSYMFVLRLNAYLKPAFDLKEVLGRIIPYEMLKDVEISWESSSSPELLLPRQLLWVSRIVMSLALSFFPENRKLGLLSVCSQVFSLFRISCQHWIKLKQNLEWPLDKVVATGGSLVGYITKKSVENLTISNYFLINPNFIREGEGLRAAVKAIWDYGSTLLEKSIWDRHWLVTSRNGWEVSRTIVYSVSLLKRSLEPYVSLIETKISAVAEQAYSKWSSFSYSWAGVKIAYR